MRSHSRMQGSTRFRFITLRKFSIMNSRLIQLAKKPFAIALVSALSLIGCGGETSKTDAQGNLKIKVNTPHDIAQESADNYDDNLNGVITGKTLKRWITDWEANCPTGIKGKLVILQQSAGPAGFEFIKPNNTNVFPYLESGWREPRSNRVMEIAGILINGPSVDNLIRKYGIDVKNDLIVCAQGTGGNAAMNQGRCWYTFRYWGVDAQNIRMSHQPQARYLLNQQIFPRAHRDLLKLTVE